MLDGLSDVELEEDPVAHDDDADMDSLRLRHDQRWGERLRTEPGLIPAASMLPLLGSSDLHKHLEIYTRFIFSMHLFHIKVNDMFYIKLSLGQEINLVFR